MFENDTDKEDVLHSCHQWVPTAIDCYAKGGTMENGTVPSQKWSTGTWILNELCILSRRLHSTEVLEELLTNVQCAYNAISKPDIIGKGAERGEHIKGESEEEPPVRSAWSSGMYPAPMIMLAIRIGPRLDMTTTIVRDI